MSENVTTNVDVCTNCWTNCAVGRRWWPYKARVAAPARAAVLYARLMRAVLEPGPRREYRRRLARLLQVRRVPSVLVLYLLKCAIHYHHYTLARQMASGSVPVVNSF